MAENPSRIMELEQKLAMLDSSEADTKVDTQLQNVFEKISVVAVAEARSEDLFRRIANLAKFTQFGRPVSHTSRYPFGSYIHKVVQQLTKRQTSFMMSKLQSLADEMRSCLLDIIELSLVSDGDDTDSNPLTTAIKKTIEE